MLSREAFIQALSGVQAQVEARRKKYLRIFYLNAVLAAVLLIVAFTFSQPLLSALAQSIGRTDPVSAWEIAAFIFFCGIVAVALILLPVLRYQGSFKPEFALHRRVFQKLCEWLGEVEISPQGTEFTHQVRASGLFSEFAGISERLGIKGRAGVGQFWIQEMAITSQDNSIEFCGVVMVYKSDVKIYGDNERRNYKLTKGNESVLHKEAAKFEGFIPLAESLLSTKIYWDNKLLHRLHTLRLKTEEWLTNRKTRPPLRAEKEYEAQFSVPPDWLKAYTPSSEGKDSLALYLCLQGNNYVLGLDCAGSVFMNFSLFERGFPHERAIFLYDLVQGIKRISLESQGGQDEPNQSL